MPSEGQQPDYLSSSDKLRDKLKWKPVENLIFAFVFGCILWWIGVEIVKDDFYTPQDRAQIKLIKKYKKQADQEFKLHYISSQDYWGYQRYLQKKLNHIQSKYSLVPFFFPLAMLSSHYYHKKLLALGLFISDILIAGISIFFIKKQLKRLDTFFFPAAVPETALKLPDKSKRLFFMNKVNEKGYTKELIDSVFSDFDKFIRLLDSGIKYKRYDEEQARKIINTGLLHMIDYAKKFYSNSLDIKKFELYSECLLWHYVVSLVGNCPTGVLSLVIKDMNLRRMFSLYTRKRLPIVYENGKINDRFETYLYLKAFYESTHKYKVLETLNELDPLKDIT